MEKFFGIVVLIQIGLLCFGIWAIYTLITWLTQQSF